MATAAQKRAMKRWRERHPDYHRLWMKARRKGLPRPRVHRKLDLPMTHDWSERAERRLYKNGHRRYKNVKILGVMVYL